MLYLSQYTSISFAVLFSKTNIQPPNLSNAPPPHIQRAMGEAWFQLIHPSFIYVICQNSGEGDYQPGPVRRVYEREAEGSAVERDPLPSVRREAGQGDHKRLRRRRGSESKECVLCWDVCSIFQIKNWWGRFLIVDLWDVFRRFSFLFCFLLTFKILITLHFLFCWFNFYLHLIVHTLSTFQTSWAKQGWSSTWCRTRTRRCSLTSWTSTWTWISQCLITTSTPHTTLTWRGGSLAANPLSKSTGRSCCRDVGTKHAILILMRMWSTRLYVDVTSVTQTLLSLNWYTVGFRFPWRKKEFNYNIFKAIWRCPWTFIEELCPSWQMLKEIDQLWQKFIAFF